MTQYAYLDHKPYAIEPGETILTFARRHGFETIPTLCDDSRLEPFGACRVCSVDVALEQGGKAKSQAS